MGADKSKTKRHRSNIRKRKRRLARRYRDLVSGKIAAADKRGELKRLREKYKDTTGTPV